jgi:hypothetical protein
MREEEKRTAGAVRKRAVDSGLRGLRAAGGVGTDAKGRDK